MPKKMPELVKNFANLLWANLPEDLMIKFLYHKDKLCVSVIDNDSKTILRRTYAHAAIIDRKTKKDLWGFCSDCADEIKKAIQGSQNDNSRKK